MQNSAPKQRKEDAYHVGSKKYVRCGIQRFRRAPRPTVRSAGHNSGRRSRPAQQQAANQFAKKPVQLRFNPDFTALQIALTKDLYADHFTFPKSGRKTIRGIADYFRKAHIPLPVVFRGILLDGSAKWRGERQANPFGKQSTTSRSTRKK